MILGLTVLTVDGVTVFGNNSINLIGKIAPKTEGEFLTVLIRLTLSLAGGTYFFSAGIAQKDQSCGARAVDRRYNAFRLSIHGAGKAFGIADLNMEMHLLP